MAIKMGCSLTKPVRGAGRALIKAPHGYAEGKARVRQLPELVAAEVVMTGREGLEDRVRRAQAMRPVSACSESGRASAAYLSVTASLDPHLPETHPLRGGFVDMVETVMRGSDRKSTFSVEM